MEKLKKALVVVAGAVLIFAGIQAVKTNETIEDHTENTPAATSEQQTTEKRTGEDSPDDDEAPGHIPYGYAGIIQAVLSTKGLTEKYYALGSSCEIVLVGQRIITSEVISKIDVGSQLAESVKELDDQSWQLAANTRMSDKDYENLLAIVEAEAGGEDIEGKIMVANVILNRVANNDFPDNVTGVIWDRAGGSPQFSPTADGRIYTVEISDTTREAVNRAIDGEDLSQGALYFISKQQADEKNVRWFDQELTFLFQHGGHSFYE